MLSVAGVRSASGAANYFAKDDYYTVEGSSEVSAWGGEGADAIGLAGEVATKHEAVALVHADGGDPLPPDGLGAMDIH